MRWPLPRLRQLLRHDHKEEIRGVINDLLQQLDQSQSSAMKRDAPLPSVAARCDAFEASATMKPPGVCAEEAVSADGYAAQCCAVGADLPIAGEVSYCAFCPGPWAHALITVPTKAAPAANDAGVPRHDAHPCYG